MKPVSTTAFYCCGTRMLDAQCGRPVCGDYLAERFMDDEAKAFVDRFLDLPRPNASTVMRHHMIDEVLCDALKRDPSLLVILVGAGFDTRAFRLKGGRWVEFDEPEVIAFKEARLPAAEAPNPVLRIPIDFAVDSLADRLAPYAHENAMVILEGVVMYLDEAQLTATARAIRTALPGAPLVADLMSRAFYEKYSKKLHDRFARFGAGFRFADRHPSEVIAAVGYETVQRQSITERAVEAGTFNMPRWLFRCFFRTLREGYALWVFRPT